MKENWRAFDRGGKNERRARLWMENVAGGKEASWNERSDLLCCRADGGDTGNRGRVLAARSGRIICKNGILSVVDVDERASRRVRARHR